MNGQPKLIIFGAGGHGHVVADVALSIGYTDIAFVDELVENVPHKLNWPIIGSEVTPHHRDCHVVVAIGKNANRMVKAQQLLAEGFTMPILIHNTAFVSSQANLGAGTVVMPMAVVNARSELGVAVIVNTASSIDHDCMVADGVHICPGAHVAGGVSIGQLSQIGIGSVVREKAVIGCNVMVAAGAVVVSDIKDGLLVEGVPARPRKK